MISVIVPVYNSEKDLEKCLQSISKQTYSEIEVILINDGSTDGSEKICLQFAEQDKRFKYFYQENAGVSAARNNGLSHISGEYFTFVDSDDWIDETYCEKMLRSAQEHNADMTFCRIKYFENGIDKPQAENGLENAVLKKHAENFLIGHSEYALGSACRVLYRSETFGSIKFEEKLHIYEDMTFVLTCLKRSNIQCVTDDYLYTYNLPQTGYFVKYYRDDVIDVCYGIGKKLNELLIDFDRVEWAKAELFKEYKLAVQWIFLKKDNAKSQIEKLKTHKIIGEFCTEENYAAYKNLYRPEGFKTKLALSLIHGKHFATYGLLKRFSH